MPRSRAETQAETRERILSAAHEEFTSRRYVDVSLDAVARRAGYSKGAVYSNFESKNDLLFSVLERYLAGISADYSLAVLTASDQDLGAEIGSRASETEASQLGYFRLLTAVWAEAVHDPEFAERFAAVRRAHRATIAEAIERRAIDAGLRLPVDAHALATGIVGMSMAALMDATIDRNVSAAEVHRVMIDLILAGTLSIAEPLDP